MVTPREKLTEKSRLKVREMETETDLLTDLAMEKSRVTYSPMD
jgi:hypothetical protein